MVGKGLWKYVGHRLLIMVPVVLLMTLAVFLLASLVPGGAVAALLEGRPTSPTQIHDLTVKYGLDKPLPIQYIHWLGGVFKGDLGRSFRTSQSVTDMVRERLSVTVSLNAIGFVLALLIGLPLGMIAALNRGTRLDRFVVGLSIFGSSSPAFFVAIFFLWLFGQKLGWFPLFGAGGPAAVDRLWHLALPGIVMAVHPLGLIMKVTRASMLDEIDQDYVSFSRARGLREPRVILAYAFRNALIPILTAAGLIFIGLLTGTVFVEQVFGLPGLGSMLVQAVTTVDLPVIQGLTLIIGTWIIVGNLIIDIAYVLVDPRISYEKAA
jgi:peptide/nickel transport system permease protein